MTFIRYNILLAFTLAGVLVLAGCDGLADLDVENPNAPDADRAITDASDLQSVLSGGYTSWWDGGYEGTPQTVPHPHLDGWGDSQTTTNAFRGFWTMATDEPRVQFQNTLSFSDLVIIEDPWQQMNAAISSANDVIRQIELNDFEVVIDGDDQTQMTLAGAYFLRALAYSHLANFFDKAYVTTEEFDPETDLADLGFSSYQEVLAQARSDFQRTREIAQGSSFTLNNFLPFSNSVTSDRLIRLANSFEARFIISNSRTPDENASVNWNEIKTLTENGIQQSVVMNLDGNTWFNQYQYISGLYWYWRVDNRIIHLMDDDYPIKYPADEAGGAIPPAESDDARLCPASGDEFEGSGVGTAAELGCYFVYDTDQSFFREARGPTLQSNYWYARDFVIQQWFQQPFAAGDGPIFLLEENRLMQAEAELRTGNKQAAIDLVNAGSRVNIGELEPLESSASEQEVLDAIFYERDIELYRTGVGLPYYDLRRRGMLQRGTPLHLPVPATELQTIGDELYTFGGVSNAGQAGTASGDNAWCDQGDLSCDGPFEVPSSTNQVQKEWVVPPKSMAEMGLQRSPFQPIDQ